MPAAARATTPLGAVVTSQPADWVVALGTDAGNPLTLHGPSVYDELEAMQAAGLTPAQVLVAATRDSARALGREKDLGTVEKGKQAAAAEESSMQPIVAIRQHPAGRFRRPRGQSRQWAVILVFWLLSGGPGSAAPDIIVATNWRTWIPPRIFNLPPFGTLNVHDALLPAYAGFSPLIWALLNDEREVGVTAHLMDDTLDAGPIVLQRAVPVGPADTTTDLFHKTLELFGPITVDVPYWDRGVAQRLLERPRTRVVVGRQAQYSGQGVDQADRAVVGAGGVQGCRLAPRPPPDRRPPDRGRPARDRQRHPQRARHPDLREDQAHGRGICRLAGTSGRLHAGAGSRHRT